MSKNLKQHTEPATVSRPRKALWRLRGASLLALSALASPAFAQLAKVTSVLTSTQAVLVGASVLIVSIAIMWAGFKILFQHAKLTEVGSILWGGILIGGAPAIAAWLVT